MVHDEWMPPKNDAASMAKVPAQSRARVSEMLGEIAGAARSGTVKFDFRGLDPAGEPILRNIRLVLRPDRP